MKNETKNSLLIIAKSLLAVLILLILASCKDDPTPVAYQDEPVGATPVISSVNPADKALAGVTTVTINGQNFSGVSENNLVFFNSMLAEILDASATRLIVKAPNLVSEEVTLKIAVNGAELFSNDYNYTLEAAVKEVYTFKDFEQPYALTTDSDGNIYFSLVSANVGQGVKRLTPQGAIEDFAPKGGETFYNGLKYGPGGSLYGVRAVRAIFKIDEGTAPATFAVLDNGTAMLDLDFDQNLNLWTGGTGGKIYSVTPEKVFSSFEFAPRVSSVRVFDNYLYVAAADDEEEAVWRFPIVSASELGPVEKVFDFSAHYTLGVVTIKAITFSADGKLLIGINGAETIIIVNSEGSYYPWYPGLLSSPVINFAWGAGNTLYYSRGNTGGFNQSIVSINMEQGGAPHYGRD
jgi:hypothetical protein